MSLFKYIKSLGKKKEKEDDIQINRITNSNVNVEVYKDSIIYKNEEEDLSLISKEELTDLDYSVYLEDIELPSFIIQRSLINEKKIDINDAILLSDEYESYSIFDVLKRESKIVLLGNPGLGKTIELKKVAIEYWNNKEIDFIPVFRNLKNFTKQDTIDGYLNIKHKSIDKVFFIFDGIDEIPYVQDFVSKLQTFLRRLEGKDYKILISCRTNVFENIVKKIDGFKICNLKDLYIKEGLEILNAKTDFPALIEKELDSNLKVFLKNPFLIGIVIDYINDNQKLPTNSAELWSNYIDKRLKVDSDDKQIKKSINTTLIKFYCKKASLANELSKRSSFTEREILMIVDRKPSEFKSFLQTPMLEKKMIEDIWYFEHKNIQEYFASKILSELEVEKILGFIKIEGIDKTHPSLFNTITFLINILDKKSKKFTSLIEWIISNEPELLFRADTDRVNDEIKEQVFQNYFTEKVIESTLWLTTGKKIDLDRISRFADCYGNFIFLIKVIENEEIHIRPRISALAVLSNFNIPLDHKESFKDFLFKYLIDKTVSKDFKSNILEFFIYNVSYNSDKDVIRDIFSVFKNETHNRINTNLLSLIERIDEVDEFSEYIIEEFLRANNLKEREDKSDNVGRGNAYKSKSLVFKLSSSKDYLKIMKYYLNQSRTHFLEDRDLDEITSKIIGFKRDDPDYCVKIFETLEDRMSYHRHQRFLFNLIEKTDSKTKVLQHILKKESLYEITYFAVRLVDESNILEVSSIIKEKGCEHDKIENFRNFLGNANSRKLAKEFDSIMRKYGVVFEKEVFTIEEEINNRELQRIERQDYLDSFFNQDTLIIGIKNFYRENNVDKISHKELIGLIYSNLEKRAFAYDDLFNSSITIMKYILYHKGGALTYQQIINEVYEDSFCIYKSLKNKIERFNSSKWSFILSEKQKEQISNWCIKTSKLIDFKNIVKVGKNRRAYSYISGDYEIIKTIFFFDNLINIDLPKEFLLGSIAYYEHENYDSSLEKYDSLFNKINDKKLFDSRIIDNIKNESTLISFVLTSHVNYAIHNNLTEVFPIIRNLYVNYDDSLINEKGILDSFYKKTKDISLLKDCCADLNENLCWVSIQIMLEKGLEKEFCCDKSLELLNGRYDVIGNHSIALSVLMFYNKIEAIEIIMEDIQNNGLDVFKRNRGLFQITGYNNYNMIKDYNIIKELFKYSYNYENVDSFIQNDYRNFTKTYLENLVETDDGYYKVREQLKSIKEILQKDEKDVFYVNMLLDSVDSKFYSYKSIPYTFTESVKLLNNII
ncbi:NACHT domain-containing protein [Tenacibaculum maritimum]|uniref:NACHT domain-containing protein n=1 Tax=Tenacibaculum maritimum TaxID=107401 RepID=UPI0010A33274|nr:hypothetical protein [Tenacibaculum maritimum]QCD62858.1 hypothetical protein B9C57_10120 [Tenacibaculum maritimum]